MNLVYLLGYAHESEPKPVSGEDAPPRKGTSLPIPVGRTLDIDIPRKYTDLKAPKVRARILWPPVPQETKEALPCLLYLREHSSSNL